MPVTIQVLWGITLLFLLTGHEVAGCYGRKVNALRSTKGYQINTAMTSNNLYAALFYVMLTALHQMAVEVNFRTAIPTLCTEHSVGRVLLN